MEGKPSPDAVQAAWNAYDKEVWNVGGQEAMTEAHKNKCMRIAIEAAAKHDGLIWMPARNSG